LGCGCGKGNNQVSKSKIKVIRHEDQVNEIVDPEPINYTQQDINRARAYFLMEDKSEMEKEWFRAFVLSHLKESVQGYCDVICKKRINAKLDKLQQRLI